MNSLAPKAHDLDPVFQRLNKVNNIKKKVIIIIIIIITCLDDKQGWYHKRGTTKRILS